MARRPAITEIVELIDCDDRDKSRLLPTVLCLLLQIRPVIESMGLQSLGADRLLTAQTEHTASFFATYRKNQSFFASDPLARTGLHAGRSHSREDPSLQKRKWAFASTCYCNFLPNELFLHAVRPAQTRLDLRSLKKSVSEVGQARGALIARD